MISCQIQIITRSVEQTQALGQKLGELIHSGAAAALTGDLGSGKTAFVQGLAKGLDVPKEYYITSPTYTLLNRYPGRHPLFHVDLYRAGGPSDLEDIGLYDFLYGDGVTAIEWADKLPEGLLSEHVALRFELLDNDSRKIYITAYGQKEIELVKQIGSSSEVLEGS